MLPPALELVDTPGINDIANFRAAVSRGELPRADILILALDATQLLKVLKLASQDRLDACAAELDAAIEAAHEVRLDTVTRPSLGDFYTVTNRGARDGHRSGARSVPL